MIEPSALRPKLKVTEDDGLLNEEVRQYPDAISLIVLSRRETAVIVLLAPSNTIFWSFGPYPDLDAYTIRIRIERLEDLSTMARETYPENGAKWSFGLWQAVYNSFGLVNWPDFSDRKEFRFWASGRCIALETHQKDIKPLTEHFRQQLEAPNAQPVLSWPDQQSSTVDVEPGQFLAPHLDRPVHTAASHDLQQWAAKNRSLDRTLQNLPPENQTLLRAGGVNLVVPPDYDLLPNSNLIEKVILSRASFLAHYGPSICIARELQSIQDGMYFFSDELTEKLVKNMSKSIDWSLVRFTPRNVE